MKSQRRSGETQQKWAHVGDVSHWDEPDDDVFLGDDSPDYAVVVDFAEVAAAAGLLTFIRGYIDELGKRAGDSTADWLERVRIRRTSKGKAELEVPDDGAVTTFKVDVNLPDEAKLALIDLDITAKGVNGHRLRWDGQKWVQAD